LDDTVFIFLGSEMDYFILLIHALDEKKVDIDGFYIGGSISRLVGLDLHVLKSLMVEFVVHILVVGLWSWPSSF
jgi:hypothetical protein